ncbi:pentapeptide repeat-containing protein [Thermococcus sp.]|uniref:pentapeptide repeat-containing protein n=1 Tax=Thermococcus sp. TaxID=35749 RepID=UPI00345AA330
MDGVEREFCNRDDCVNFRGVVFKEDVNFEHAIFGYVSFYGAVFEKEAYILTTQKYTAQIDSFL